MNTYNNKVQNERTCGAQDQRKGVISGHPIVKALGHQFDKGMSPGTSDGEEEEVYSNEM